MTNLRSGWLYIWLNLQSGWERIYGGIFDVGIECIIALAAMITVALLISMTTASLLNLAEGAWEFVAHPNFQCCVAGATVLHRS